MSHNTVSVGNYSQMKKGSHFIWFYWTQARKAQWTEDEAQYIFMGEVSAFRFLNPRAFHQRTVVKTKGVLEWKVIDKVIGLPGMEKIQIWHHDGFKLNLAASINNNEPVKKLSRQSYNSTYYGVKEQGEASAFVFDDEISTTLKIVSSR